MRRFFTSTILGMILEIVLVSGAFFLTVNQPSWLFTALLLAIIAACSAWTSQQLDRFSYPAALFIPLPVIVYFGWYLGLVRPERGVYLAAILPLLIGASLLGGGLASSRDFRKRVNSL